MEFVRGGNTLLYDFMYCCARLCGAMLWITSEGNIACDAAQFHNFHPKSLRIFKDFLCLFLSSINFEI